MYLAPDTSPTQEEYTMNHVISKDGTTIAFERSGDGPPVILVSGASADRSAGSALAALLAPQLAVFNYDRRGRGDSGDTLPYAVEREIEDIEALLVEAGGSACVLGWSSGAVLALDAAAHGLPITKLALYEPPFIVDDSRPPVPEDYVNRLTELAATGHRGEAVEYFMTQAILLPADMIAQIRLSPMWPELEKLAQTLAYDGAVMGDTMRGNPLPEDRWSSVTIPTLIMDGGASPEFMHNAAGALAETLAHAQRRTLEGQTHAVAPEVLAPVLEAFFLS
jgi:pimeloyl-ACP methyl ester carboxylesterase